MNRKPERVTARPPEKSSFDFSFLAGPEGLAGYLNTLYSFASEESVIEDIMPAYSPQLMLVTKGSAQLRFADGRVAQSSPAFFVTQLDQAAPFRIDGPMEMVGASLKIHGWAALTGLPMDEWGNRVVPAGDALPADVVARLEAISSALSNGTIDPADACAKLGEVLQSALRPLPAAHAEFIDVMQAWLTENFNPHPADFMAHTSLSQRQVQRLTKRFFGRPLARLIRRYRAIRSATLMTLPSLPPEIEAEVLEGFYDQAHLIKEIRHFTGKTPRLLSDAAGTVSAKTLGPEGYNKAPLFDQVARSNELSSE